MKDAAVFALLTLILIIVFIGTAYIIIFYYEYRCDKDKIKDNREMIKELTLVMMRREGLEVNEINAIKDKKKTSSAVSRIFT